MDTSYLATQMAVNNSLTTLALIEDDQAQQAAEKAAKTAGCIPVMDNFDAALSTVEQKQVYAECIQVIYPRPVTEDHTLWIGFLKIHAAMFLCVLFIVFAWMWARDDETFAESLGVAFWWAVVLTVVSIVIGGLIMFLAVG